MEELITRWYQRASELNEQYNRRTRFGTRLVYDGEQREACAYTLCAQQLRDALTKQKGHYGEPKGTVAVIGQNAQEWARLLPTIEFTVDWPTDNVDWKDEVMWFANLEDRAIHCSRCGKQAKPGEWWTRALCLTKGPHHNRTIYLGPHCADEIRAYLDGRLAREAGRTNAENPYTKMEHRRLWNRGYTEQMSEEK